MTTDDAAAAGGIAAADVDVSTDAAVTGWH